MLRNGEHWAGLDRLTAASVLAGMVVEYPSCLMELLMAYANLKSFSDFLLHLKKSELLSNHDLMLLFDTRKIVYRTPIALYSALSGDKVAVLSLIIAVKNDILPEKRLNLLLGEHYPELYQDMKHVNHVNIDTVLNAELTRLLQACTQGKSYEADLTAYPFLNLSEENVLRYFLTPYQHLLPQIQKIFHQLLILPEGNMLVPVQKQNEKTHTDIRQQ